MPLLLTADANPGTASWSTADVSHGVVAAGSVVVPGVVPPLAPAPVLLTGVLPGDVLSVTIAVDDPGVSLVSIVGAVVVAPDLVQIITTGGIATAATLDIVAFRSL